MDQGWREYPASFDRAAFLRQVRRVVIKIGSAVLTTPESGVDRHVFAGIASGVAALHRAGIQPVLVSSGAIAMGMERLGMRERPPELAVKQALAAIGQSALMQLWNQEFGVHGLVAGQVLLTHEDLRQRGRFLNARRTLHELIARKAIPVINENDTVSVDEIKLGDNDRLSAQVCNLVQADLLVILTELEGLYSADPRSHPDARLISVAYKVDARVRAMVGVSQSSRGTGGMATKVEAVAAVNRAGIPAVVISGKRPGGIGMAVRGEEIGTFFVPSGDRPHNSRKGWIAFSLKPSGSLTVDAGAASALTTRGKSLLPGGVAAVYGQFPAGAPVDVLNPEGEVIARGLVRYSADQIRRIMGLPSSRIRRVLGEEGPDEIIHCNDMAVL
ncbi:MAG: Glutamate 5-kinase [Myxococcota bacterium]|nr:Glutamate 5-kinase [Myxococcota bacterium]